MYLIFDTETTGFPKKDLKDPDNPHVTQLAWALYTKEKKLFKKFQTLILPEGWEMPSVDYFLSKGKTQKEAEDRAKFWIDNGFTQQKSLEEGMPIKKAVYTFLTAIEECEYLIAHNMNFDLAIMSIEMFRLNVQAAKRPIKVCTMQTTTDILKLPGRHSFKRPSLAEVHNYLFGCNFEGAHDAMADVEACAKCFFELVKRELIILPKNE